MQSTIIEFIKKCCGSLLDDVGGGVAVSERDQAGAQGFTA